MGKNIRRVTKQKWYESEYKKVEVKKEYKENKTIYTIDNKPIDISNLKFAYFKKYYFKKNIFKNPKNFEDMFFYMSNNEEDTVKKGRGKVFGNKSNSTKYLKVCNYEDGKEVKENQKKVSYKPKLHEEKEILVRKLYGEKEEELLENRFLLKKEINGLFDAKSKKNYEMNDNKIICNQQFFDGVDGIIKKFKGTRFYDENSKFSNIYGSIKYNINDHNYNKAIKYICDALENNKEIDKNQFSEALLGQINRCINASLDINCSNNKIRINDVINEFLEDNIIKEDELKKEIHGQISKYKLKVLLSELEKNVGNPISKIKEHYVSNASNIEFYDGKNDELKKNNFFQREIHNYMKGRGKKLENNKEYTINKDELNKKIEDSIINKFRIQIINKNNKFVFSDDSCNREELSIKKQIFKLNESLKIKLIPSIQEIVYVSKKDMKESITDEFLGVSKIDVLEKKIKSESKEMRVRLKQIYILRNFLFHKQKFGINGVVDEKESIDFVRIPLNEDSIRDSIIFRFKSNCYERVDGNLMVKIIDEIDYDYKINVLLPSFNKVLNKMTTIEITDESRPIYNYFYKEIYRSGFSKWIEDNEKFISFKENINFVNFHSYKESNSLSECFENIQKIEINNRRHVTKKFIKLIALLFESYLEEKSLKLVLLEEGNTPLDENELKNKLENKLKNEIKIFNEKSIESKYINSICALSDMVSTTELNKLINSLVKYKQYYIKLNNSYKNEMTQYFTENSMDDMENLEDDLNVAIRYLSLELFNKNYELDNEKIKGINDKYLQIFNVNDNYENMVDISYRITTKGITKIQGVLKESNSKTGEYIESKILKESMKYGYLEKTIDNHIYAAKKINFKYSDKLKEFGNYLSDDCENSKETINKIESLQTNRKEFIEDKKIDSDFINTIERINEFNFLKNMIYLRSMKKGLQIQRELNNRMLAWAYIYERDLSPLKSKPQNVQIKKNFLNHITHGNYWNSENLITDPNEGINILKQIKGCKEFLDFSTCRKNSVVTSLISVLEKNSIVLKENYGINDVVKCIEEDNIENLISKFESKNYIYADRNKKEFKVACMSQDEYQYLMRFIFN